MPRCRATALLLLLLLVASVGASSGGGQPTLEVEGAFDSARACAVDDLVPPNGEDISDMWDKETLVSPQFDCTCRTLKARYSCVCACVFFCVCRYIRSIHMCVLPNK